MVSRSRLIPSRRWLRDDPAAAWRLSFMSGLVAGGVGVASFCPSAFGSLVAAAHEAPDLLGTDFGLGRAQPIEAPFVRFANGHLCRC